LVTLTLKTQMRAGDTEQAKEPFSIGHLVGRWRVGQDYTVNPPTDPRDTQDEKVKIVDSKAMNN